MSTKLSNTQFSKIFDKIAPQYNSILNKYAVSRRIEFIAKYAKGKCLEVGAGNGIIAISLRKKHQVTATDISSEMVKQIRMNKIKAYVCDAEKLPFKDKTFETVIAAELIYYLDHPEKFISEAYRILKPNGKLIITSASNITLIYDKIRTFFRKIGFRGMYFNDQNKRFITQDKLFGLLSQGNFIIKTKEKTIIFPFFITDKINRFIEKTFFNCFSSFIFIKAQKC